MSLFDHFERPAPAREPVAWVFNLDAEDELERGGPHQPKQTTRSRVESLLPQLRRLLGPEDEVLWPGEKGRARRGRAWCPTPWAREEIARAGLQMDPAPTPEVLRAVNHRRFAHNLGQALPLARFVQDEKALVDALSQPVAEVSVERNWLMKRALGYAGRGRRKIASSQLSSADRTWIAAALRSGIMVEPFVAREGDFSLHGWLTRDGALRLGAPTRQNVDAAGTWISTERTDALSLGELEQLELTARATAAELTSAGYFGPFGLDAFRWRGPDGAIHFQPRCELNARYSMGWAIGMFG